MKATKKIIPALVMLLVSAVLLSTASYAWFSMNNQVTATGMQVTATALTSLLISTTNANEGFAASATFEADNDMTLTIVPVTQTAAEANTFNKLTTDGMKMVNPDGTLSGTATYESTGTDFFHDKFWLSVDDDTVGTVVNYSFQVASTAETPDEIYKAMRVGFWDGETMKVVEVSELETEYTGELYITTATNQVSAWEIYVWYEGTDSDCKNANAVNGDAFSIELTFTLAE